MIIATLAQVDSLYADYVQDYDPSPLTYGGGYSSPLSFEDWLDDDSEGLEWIAERDGLEVDLSVLSAS